MKIIIIGIVIFWIIVSIFNKFIMINIISKYQVDDFFVVETYTNHHRSKDKATKDSYLFDFSLKEKSKIIFSFKIMTNKNIGKKLITKIYHHKEDKLECIYPVFKDNKNNIDILCFNDSYYLNYSAIDIKSNELLKFKEKIEKDGYSFTRWKEQKTKTIDNGNFTIFQNNLLANNYLVLWNYKEIILASAQGKKTVPLFKKDEYTNGLGFIIENKYILPDYDQKFEFDKFYIIDVKTGKTNEIKFKNSISFGAYVQGIVDGKAYLLDKSNKEQWEIDAKRETVTLIGDIEHKAKYYDDKWEEVSIYSFIDDKKYFKKSINIKEIDENAYNNIVSVGGFSDGYYYLSKSSGNNIEMYRALKENPKIITYLFTTDEIKNVKYYKNHIYFINNDKIMVYNDNIGLQPIVKNNEFKFNYQNIYEVYIEE